MYAHIYIYVYHPPHNRPIFQNFPKILSSKRCTAVTNPSTYQPRSRNEGGAVPFRSATTAFRVAKYLAVSKNRKTKGWLDGPLEKRMNFIGAKIHTVYQVPQCVTLFAGRSIQWAKPCLEHVATQRPHFDSA